MKVASRWLVGRKPLPINKLAGGLGVALGGFPRVYVGIRVSGQMRG
jgi:hypothetical protein